MNDADRDAIQDLFARLRAAEADGPERDPAAEAYIRDRLEQHPAAAYYMAQTVIAQERALRVAQRRLEEAEDDAPRAQGGGFLGNLFGGGRRDEAPPAGPWGAAPSRSGGGFLAGAAQTAVGVAGGVMLGHALTDLLDGDEGHERLVDAGDAHGFADLQDSAGGHDDGGSAGFGDTGDDFGGDDF